MAGADIPGEAAHNTPLASDNPSYAPSQQPEQAPKRRRTGGSSSRGVANLTPEQLARKRANDREAQRAIRERTKNQIERLSRRIRELESQQPYHDLQVVVREKEAVQAENADIRLRLEQALALITPILRPSNGLNELATAAERSSLSGPVRPPLRDVAHPHEPRSGHSIRSDLASPQNGVPSPAGTDSSPQWLYSGDTPAHPVRSWSSDSAHYEQPRPVATPAQADMPFDGRMGVDYVLDNGQRRVDLSVATTSPHPPQSATPGVGHYAPLLVPHLTLPRTIPSTCILDDIMLKFLGACHAEAAEGVPLHVIAGPAYPNFTALVHRERSSESHRLSKLFTDIIGTFTDISRLTEQVAVVYVMFLVMRWQIAPTEENYDRLPEWFTPRPSQLFVPHPYWFNFLPWPRLRDRLIAARPFIPFSDFFVPYTKGLSLNWPYNPKDCLIPASRAQADTPTVRNSTLYTASVHADSSSQQPGVVHPSPTAAVPSPVSTGLPPQDNDQWVINPEFEAHIRDLRNWTLGPEFRAAYPQLADAVTIKVRR